MKKLLTDEEIKRIEAAIERAELKTSAEIVPVLASRSTPIFSQRLGIFLLLILFLNSCAYVAIDNDSGSVLWMIELGILVVSYFGSAWLVHRTLFFKAFSAELETQNMVDLRAELEFFRSNIKATANKTGVLLFVSAHEHKAVILADKAITSVFPNETWGDLIKVMISKIRAGGIAAGMEACIDQLGDTLATRFPIQKDDQNELKNHLILRDF